MLIVLAVLIVGAAGVLAVVLRAISARRTARHRRCEPAPPVRPPRHLRPVGAAPPPYVLEAPEGS